MNLHMPTQSYVPTTAPFSFVSGVFGGSAWTIPYFVSSIPAREALTVLSTSDDMPGAHRDQWRLTDLFQREINWTRVIGEIYPYLRDEGVPHFFNALIVALVPKDDQTGQLRPTFDRRSSWKPPAPLPDTAWNEPIGPIQVNWFAERKRVESGELPVGQIQWNTDQVFGLTIDGQHRLAAVKKLNAKSPSAIAGLRLPVIFLVLDEAAGYKTPDANTEIRPTARRLFIDINKHAKQVSPARQILLNDFDVSARGTHALISEELEAGIEALSKPLPTLPLSLVDWISEGAKFHEGPFITTVVGLNEQVEELLGKAPGPMDYLKHRDRLRLWKRNLGFNTSNMEKRRAQCQKHGDPFGLEDSELDEIVNTFKERYSQYFVTALTGFQPYRDLIEKRQQLATFSTEWQWWFKLSTEKVRRPENDNVVPDRARDFEDDLKEDDFPLRVSDFEGALQQITQFKESNLAFFVAFQRAYFHALLWWTRNSKFFEAENVDEQAAVQTSEIEEEFSSEEEKQESASDEWESQDKDDNLSTVEQPEIDTKHAAALEFVMLLNSIVSECPSFLELEVEFPDNDGRGQKLWMGSLAQAEEPGVIDFTKAASVRAGHLIKMAVGLRWVRSRTSSDVTFDSVWNRLREGDTDLVSGRLAQVANNLFSDSNSVGGRCVAANKENFTEELASNEVKNRLVGLWNQMST